MKSFFQDNYINTKILTRLTREIKTQQLKETINELAYLNELQSKIISNQNIDVSSQELNFIKKIRDAKRSN